MARSRRRKAGKYRAWVAVKEVRPPAPSPALSPYHWYVAALFPIAIGLFMYGMEASDVQRFRLADPVAAMGEFVTAKCITYRKGRRTNVMVVTYAFVATAPVQYDGNLQATQALSNYTTDYGIEHRSREDCDAALPEVLAAKAPHPVWYERTQPHTARLTLEEPDSTRFLWVGLGALPLAGVGWWMRRRASVVDA